MATKLPVDPWKALADILSGWDLDGTGLTSPTGIVVTEEMFRGRGAPRMRDIAIAHSGSMGEDGSDWADLAEALDAITTGGAVLHDISMISEHVEGLAKRSLLRNTKFLDGPRWLLEGLHPIDGLLGVEVLWCLPGQFSVRAYWEINFVEEGLRSAWRGLPIGCGANSEVAAACETVLGTALSWRLDEVREYMKGLADCIDPVTHTAAGYVDGGEFQLALMEWGPNIVEHTEQIRRELRVPVVPSSNR